MARQSTKKSESKIMEALEGIASSAVYAVSTYGTDIVLV